MMTNIYSKKSNLFLIATILFFLLASGAQDIHAQEDGNNKSSSSDTDGFRIWKSSNGKFEFEGRFLSKDGATVTLEKKDGGTIDVSLIKLSQSDRDYVKKKSTPSKATRTQRLRERMGVQAGQRFDRMADLMERHAEMNASGNAAGNGAEDALVKAAENAAAKAASSNVMKVPFADDMIELGVDSWDFLPDPLAYGDRPPGNTIVFPKTSSESADSEAGTEKAGASPPISEGHLELRRMMREARTGTSGRRRVVFSDDGTVCGLILEDLGSGPTVVQIIEVASGKILVEESIEDEVMAVSPKKSLIAIVEAEEDLIGNGRLVIREIGKPDSVVFEHVTKSLGSQNDFLPDKGFFSNDSIFVSLGRRLVAIDVDSGDGFCTSTFGSNRYIDSYALSPNRKQVLVFSGKKAILFDVDQRKPIGELDIAKQSITSACFSPDGLKVAVQSSMYRNLKIFDLTTGEKEREYKDFRTGSERGDMAWPEDRYLIRDDLALMDLESEDIVWKYKLAAKGAVLRHVGGTQFFLQNELSIVPVKIPHSGFSATDNLATALENDPLKSGDQVRLELKLPYSLANIHRVRTNFEDQLKRRGVLVGPSKTKAFILEVEFGEKKTVTTAERGAKKNIFGQRKGATSISYTPSVSKMRLVVDGKTVWSRIKSNRVGAGTLIVEGKETPQQAATRLCRPEVEFFSRVSFPKYFDASINDRERRGNSTISADGIQDK